jgi:hypothetical protein
VVVACCVAPVVVDEPNRPPPVVPPNVDVPNPPVCSVVEPSPAPNGLAVVVGWVCWPPNPPPNIPLEILFHV